MTQESLRELLARLHERLSASGSVDREARALLGTVMRDIDRALASGAHTDPATLTPATAPAPRLESLALDFEAGHPGLAALPGELTGPPGKSGLEPTALHAPAAPSHAKL